MSDKTRDPAILASSQYKTADNVNARWEVYNYSVPHVDIYTKALEHLKLTGDESVLEVGCGDGSILLKLREQLHHSGELTGLEINDTIVKPTEDYLSTRPAIKNIRFVVGSADIVPFRDNSFDVILAFFMLYHLKDIPGTLTEWSRLLGPHGKLVVSTSSVHNRPKGKSLKLDMARTSGSKLPQAKFNEPFNLENGREQLERVFKVTDLVTFEGEIRITNPEIYLRSIDSIRDMYEPVLGDEAWLAARDYAKQVIQAEIDEKGYFADTVKRGYFICEQSFLDRR